MPQRFLRPGIRTSERWNSISRNAQALYIALLTLVDDYGRYDGRVSVLHGDAFSVWNELNPENAVSRQATAAVCAELSGKMVGFYEYDGRIYVQILQWQERVRNKSKWPEPKNDKWLPMAADGCQNLPPSPSPSPSPSPIAICRVAPDDEQCREVSKPQKLQDRIDLITKARVVLGYLNQKAGRVFRETDTNLTLASSRVREVEGDVEGIKKMIDRQCERWLGDTKMEEFLRPSTLFGKTKFHEYYDNRELPVLRENTAQNPRNNNANAGHEDDYADVGTAEWNARHHPAVRVEIPGQGSVPPKSDGGGDGVL